MTVYKRDYKDFYYSFRFDIMHDKFKAYEPYKIALHNLFTAFDFYNMWNVDINKRYIEKVIRLVTRNNITDDRIDENLVKVIKNTGRMGSPDIFFEMIYAIVDPKEISKINVVKLVRAFYLLLIDSMYQWESDSKDEKLLEPYRNVRIDKFRDLMLHVYSLNIDSAFKQKRDSVADDTTKLYILCNIIAYIYLYDKGYELIDKFVNNSDYYLSKLRLDGMFYEPGYSTLDDDMGNLFFYQIEEFINDNYHKGSIL